MPGTTNSAAPPIPQKYPILSVDQFTLSAVRAQFMHCCDFWPAAFCLLNRTRIADSIPLQAAEKLLCGLWMWWLQPPEVATN